MQECTMRILFTSKQKPDVILNEKSSDEKISFCLFGQQYWRVYRSTRVCSPLICFPVPRIWTCLWINLYYINTERGLAYTSHNEMSASWAETNTLITDNCKYSVWSFTHPGAVNFGKLVELNLNYFMRIAFVWWNSVEYFILLSFNPRIYS